MHTLQRLLQRRGTIHAHPRESVLEVARRMSEHGVGAIPILEGETLVGIFSERDLMTRVVVRGRDPAATRVEKVMTREVVTATFSESTRHCEEKMRRAGCRHLPVLAEGRLLAMLSMRDLLRDEIEEQAQENRELRAYLHQGVVNAAPWRPRPRQGPQ